MHERFYDDSTELGFRLWEGRDVMCLREEELARMARAIQEHGELQVWTHTHYEYVEPTLRVTLPPFVKDEMNRYFTGLEPWIIKQKRENSPVLALIEYEDLAQYARYYGVHPSAFSNLWYCSTFIAEATPMHPLLQKQEYWALKQMVNIGRAARREDEEIVLRHTKENDSDWGDVDTVLLDELFYMEQARASVGWDMLAARLREVGATSVRLLGACYKEVSPITDTDMRFVSQCPGSPPAAVPHACVGQTCKELAVRNIGIHLEDDLLIPQRPSREVKAYLEYLDRARPF